MRATVKFFIVLACAALPAIVVAQGNVSIEQAWVRALPPTSSNTAAYMTILNAGPDVAIVRGGSSEIAQAVEVHRTVEVDGMMRMEQLDELRIAPGEQAVLAPGGTHLMLLNLTTMPAAGDEVRLCVQLASGAEVCTVAPARKSVSSGKAHAHHH